MNLRLTFVLLFLFGTGIASAQPAASSATPSSSSAKSSGPSARPKPPAAPRASGTSALITPLSGIDDFAAGALGFLNPSISYSIQYGDAIPSAPGQQRKSTTQQLSPSVRARFAEQWILSYTPSFSWYSNDAFTDQVSHSAQLQGTGVIGETDVGLSLIYSRSNDVLLETAQQTKQEFWGTSGSAGYAITERMRLEGSASQQFRYTDFFTDTKTSGATVGLRYKHSEDLNLGLSAGAGYTTMDPGLNYATQDLTANTRWTPSARLSLDLSFGTQLTRFRVDNAKTRAAPTYNASIQYQIFEPTSVSLSASRSTGASYFSSQISDLSQVSIRLSQRLLGRFSLSVSASEVDHNYVCLLYTSPSPRD